MSHVVAEMAKLFGTVNNDTVEQAWELVMPVEDYETAAREYGWVETSGRMYHEPSDRVANSWQEACALDGADPYINEIYEHWAISEWLGKKLEARGERVDFDFCGLVVWGRTTTGQAISMDHVIQEIAREVL